MARYISRSWLVLVLMRLCLPAYSFSLLFIIRKTFFNPCIPSQVHAFLHDTKASWLVHMETKAANRQDLAADIWSEVEYQLGSQWFVLLRDHAVRCATKEHVAWAKYRTYCEVSVCAANSSSRIKLHISSSLVFLVNFFFFMRLNALNFLLLRLILG